jgi:hypothetical protein
MWQCQWCWIFSRRYTETCLYCSSEAIVMVADEDWQEYGYLLKMSLYISPSSSTRWV